MDTKEAIEFSERQKMLYKGEYPDEIDKVIELLKHGEKYKTMWEEFYKNWGEYPIELHNIDEFMDDIKQKYFPEKIIDKVVEGITEQIEEGAEIAKEDAKSDNHKTNI